MGFPCNVSTVPLLGVAVYYGCHVYNDTCACEYNHVLYWSVIGVPNNCASLAQIIGPCTARSNNLSGSIAY